MKNNFYNEISKKNIMLDLFVDTFIVHLIREKKKDKIIILFRLHIKLEKETKKFDCVISNIVIHY